MSGYDKYLEYQYRQTGDFYALLFRAIQQADGENLDRLAQGFPTEVEAYKCWTRIGVKEFATYVTPGHRLLDTFRKEYQLEEVIKPGSAEDFARWNP